MTESEAVSKHREEPDCLTGVEDGSVVPPGSEQPAPGHYRPAEETDGDGGEK